MAYKSADILSAERHLRAAIALNNISIDDGYTEFKMLSKRENLWSELRQTVDDKVNGYEKLARAHAKRIFKDAAAWFDCT